MDYFIIICLFIFSFFFRSLLRFIFKNSLDYDTYFHLYLIEYIRNNGINNLVEPKRFIKPFGIHYPWLMHFCISLFPKKFDMIFERFFNPLLDAIFIVFLYIITLYITSSNNQSLIVAILYIFTPAMFTTLSVGPRIKSFTPRLFGEIMGILMFIFEYLYFINGDYIFLILTILFSSLAYLSSKFSLQAIFLINIFLFLFTFNMSIVIILFSGLLFTIIITRGKFLEILFEHLHHLKWYFLKNLESKMGISNRNSFFKLFNYLKSKKYKTFFSTLLLNNSFIIVLTRFPLIYLSMYIIYNDYITLESIGLIDYFILSSVIIFFISSLKWFLFIGESERYLNYVVIFIFLKVIFVFSDNLYYLYLYVFYGLLFYILDFKLLLRKNKKFDDILIKWLKNHEKELNIATIPYDLGGWRIVQSTHHNWIYANLWINAEEKEFFEENFFYKYPFIDINKADKLIEYYNLDYVIYNKLELDNRLEKDYYIPKNLEKIQINENLFALHKKSEVTDKIYKSKFHV